MSAVSVVRPAAPNDAEAIRALLAGSGLATADLVHSHPEFVVACEGQRLVGVGGLEVFGATGLVRSVAVAADRRGLGIARTIVRRLEERGRQLGLSQLVLLTQTAREFFERQGYGVIERQRAPAPVQASEEFRSLCPTSALCMVKRIGGSDTSRQSNG